jgi:hypothetical protein
MSSWSWRYAEFPEAKSYKIYLKVCQIPYMEFLIILPKFGRFLIICRKHVEVKKNTKNIFPYQQNSVSTLNITENFILTL